MKDSQRKAIHAKLKNGDRVIIFNHKGLNGSVGKLRITDAKYGQVTVKDEIGGGRSSTTLKAVRLSTLQERQKAIDDNKELHRILDEDKIKNRMRKIKTDDRKKWDEKLK